jgi:hypothetical protein
MMPNKLRKIRYIKRFSIFNSATDCVKFGCDAIADLDAIDELPRTHKALWIRLLGRDQTQLTALQEVSKLSILPTSIRSSVY